MKSKLSNALIILVLLVGVSLFLYPSVSEYINSRHQTRAIRSYDESVSAGMSDETIEDFFRSADEYNRRLAETDGAFYHPDTVSGYNETLDVTGTGIMGYITIDKIKVELPVYHSVDVNVLQIAAGHLPGTSLPVGGAGTHAVLSGHRGLPSSKLFTDLDKLEVGDVFYVTILNRLLTYQVDQIKTVLPVDTDDLQTERGKDYCTLMTCTPYGINSHRLLVRGVRVDNSDEKAPVYIANEAYQIDPLIVAPVAAAPVLIVLAVILMVQSIKKSHRDRIRRKNTMKTSHTGESDGDAK